MTSSGIQERSSRAGREIGLQDPVYRRPSALR
jgi:hypothetical protein